MNVEHISWIRIDVWSIRFNQCKTVSTNEAIKHNEVSMREFLHIFNFEFEFFFGMGRGGGENIPRNATRHILLLCSFNLIIYYKFD